MREAGAQIGVVPRRQGTAPAEGMERRVVPDQEWLPRLSVPGPVRDETIGLLHELMVRAAWHQVNRMPEAAKLGAARRAEIVQAAADEATVSVLARLGTFEGRSRFTTWAYKFGILHAGVELRRVAWRGGRSISARSPSRARPGPVPKVRRRSMTSPRRSGGGSTRR